MNTDSNANGETRKDAGPGTPLDDLDRQCLRILRCTAQAMASSPGGLRFKAGTRPWLDGISRTAPARAKRNGRSLDSAARPSAN